MRRTDTREIERERERERGNRTVITDSGKYISNYLV
jgi:hypothetical protein